MKNKVRYLLATGLILCGFGVVFYGAGSLLGGKDYVKAADLNRMDGSAMRSDGSESWSMDKTRIDDISRLKIELENIDLAIRPSNDDNYYLEYQLDVDENGGGSEAPLSYQVSDGTLTLKEEYGSGSTHYVHVDIGFLSAFYGGENVYDYENVVTVYIPEEAVFTDSNIVLTDGDMMAEGLRIEASEIELTYGDLKLTDCLCKDSRISCGDGDLTAEKLTVEGDTVYESEYGDIEIELAQACSSSINLNLSASYGEIETGKDIQGDKTIDSDDDIVRFERQLANGSGTLKVITSDGDITIR